MSRESRKISHKTEIFWQIFGMIFEKRHGVQQTSDLQIQFKEDIYDTSVLSC